MVLVLLCGAVDGAARLDRWLRAALGRAGEWRRPIPGPPEPGAIALTCACLIGVVTLWLVQHFSFRAALELSCYSQRQTPAMRAMAGAIASIPSGVAVEAIPAADSSLEPRDTVMFWSGYAPLSALWVIGEVTEPEYTWPTVAAERQRVAPLERNGYRVVCQRRGIIVRHGQPAGPLAAGDW